MSLQSTMKKYYPSAPHEYHYNCAEAMLISIEEFYKIVISDDAKIQMLAFGGGLQVKETCGLLIGTYAGITHLYTQNIISRERDLKTILQSWNALFKSSLGSTQCYDLKNETDHCNKNAQTISYLFEKFINEL